MIPGMTLCVMYLYRLTGMNPMSWVPQTPFGSGTSTVTASS